MYISFRNYKYDTGPHQVQTGPSYEGYVVVSSGIQDTGADVGKIVAGTPSYSGTYSTDWRQVPAAVSGYWNDYENSQYMPSGVLSSYQGYRPVTVDTIAGRKVQTFTGPDYGVRDAGKYTYFEGSAPDTQVYDPYNTPTGNTGQQGITGGGVTHGRYEGTILTNSLGPQGTANRAEWVYHPPVYCKTYTQTIRTEQPGLMSIPFRFMYRGRAAKYVSNYGSIYYQLPEGVRNMYRKLG
jgi:hypothetical protein